MTRNQKIDAAHLLARIQATHPAPEWACLAEVGNSTGYAARRHADAVAMSLWPSRGLTIRGFEIKVSRADYKRESADPEKAESIARYCDEWWIVAPEGLIREPEIELPPAWGLMVPDDKTGLRVARKATPTPAQELGRPFLAAMLRRAQEAVAKIQEGWIRREEIQERIDAAEALGKIQVPREVEFIRREADKLRKRAEEWKAATGIDISGSDRKSNLPSIIARYKRGCALMGEPPYGDDVGQAREHVEMALRQLKDVQAALAALVVP